LAQGVAVARATWVGPRLHPGPASIRAAAAPRGRAAMPEKPQISLSRNPEALPEDLLAEYEPMGEDLLGEGSFAVIRLVRSRKDGELFALKCVEKHQLRIRNMMDQAKREVRIHQRLSHPNILRLVASFDDSAYFYMLLEYCERGALRSIVQEAPGGRLGEQEAAFYFEQIAQGVEWMHRHSWIHRDLKLENMLVTAGGELKICDFGWSAEVEFEQLLKTTCGTTAYWAPEMWECAPQDEAVDQWALGCLLYEMLAGHPPFFAPDQEELRKKVLAVQFAYPPWFSNEACHAIAYLLQRDPRHRIRCKEVLSHAWLRKYSTRPKALQEMSGKPAATTVRPPTPLEAPVQSPGLRGRTPPSIRREVSFDLGEGGAARSSLVAMAMRPEQPRSPLLRSRMTSPVRALANSHIAYAKQGDQAPALPSTPIARAKRLVSPAPRSEGSAQVGTRQAICGRADATKPGDTAAATPSTPIATCHWRVSATSRRDPAAATPSVPLAPAAPSTPLAPGQRQLSPVRLIVPEASREGTGQASPVSPLPWQSLTPPSRSRFGNSVHVQVLANPAPATAVPSTSSWNHGFAFGTAAQALAHPAIMLPMPLPAASAALEGSLPMGSMQLPHFAHGPASGLLPQPVPISAAVPQTSRAAVAASNGLPPRLPRTESSSLGPAPRTGGLFIRHGAFPQHCNAYAAAGLGGFQPGPNGMVCDVF